MARKREFRYLTIFSIESVDASGEPGTHYMVAETLETALAKFRTVLGEDSVITEIKDMSVDYPTIVEPA